MQFFKLTPKEEAINKIKNDVNFFDTYDYTAVHAKLTETYYSSKKSQTAITPSLLQNKFNNKYYDIRICGLLFENKNDEYGYVGINDSQVLQVDKEGIITIHQRLNIENDIIDQPLDEPLKSCLRGVLQKSYNHLSHFDDTIIHAVMPQ